MMSSVLKVYWVNLKNDFIKWAAPLAGVSPSKMIFFAALFLITFTNGAFFSNVFHVYPVNLKNILPLFSLAVVSAGVIALLLLLSCYRYTIKPVMITVLIVSSMTSYFMDSYNLIIDDAMIQNMIMTHRDEVLDLLSVKLFLYIACFGIAPSVLIYKTTILFRSKWQESLSRIKLVLLTLSTIVMTIFLFGDFYSSFFREHKPLRFYANPSYYLYSTGKYMSGFIQSDRLPLKQIGLDAKIPKTDTDRELIIFVLGETARADRFSLNGYKRETNPFLKKENIVSFTNFWSCGTSTAVSVPCMFSIYGASQYTKEKAQSTENVLDIMKHAGVHVLWLDNNSDSKGVAERVDYQSYKRPDINPVCDTECRDIGMLEKLQAYIDQHSQGDIFIVLHQMGNHGPDYYKRVPASFEKFTPICKTNELRDCSDAEIGNAYDNAILYTDYFLSRTIAFLKQNHRFETALFYVSDHGESLGENRLYLHGLPNMIAPETQRHVPAMLWISDHYDTVDLRNLAQRKDKQYTHDAVFHSLLGLLEIETSLYDKRLDLLQN